MHCWFHFKFTARNLKCSAFLLHFFSSLPYGPRWLWHTFSSVPKPPMFLPALLILSCLTYFTEKMEANKREKLHFSPPNLLIYSCHHSSCFFFFFCKINEPFLPSLFTCALDPTSLSQVLAVFPLWFVCFVLKILFLERKSMHICERGREGGGGRENLKQSPRWAGAHHLEIMT